MMRIPTIKVTIVNRMWRIYNDGGNTELISVQRKRRLVIAIIFLTQIPVLRIATVSVDCFPS